MKNQESSEIITNGSETPMGKAREVKEDGLLSEVVREAIVGMTINDAEGNFLFANDSACQMLGYSLEELRKLTLADIRPDKSVDEMRSAIAELKPTGESLSFVSQHLRKDGSTYSAEVSINTRDVQDKGLVFAIFRDISQDKTQNIRRDHLNFLVESASDSIYVFDETLDIVYANQTAVQQSGYSLDELTTMNARDLDQHFPSSGLGEYGNLGESDSKRVFESEYASKGGSAVPVEISLTANTFDEKVLISSFVRDISERVQVQKAFEAGEERFRIIADTSPVALIISRIGDGRILYANKQAAELFTRSREELNITNIKALFEAGSVDDGLFSDLLRGKGITNRELQIPQLQGDYVWVSVNARTFDLQGEDVLCCALLDVTEARELSNQLSYQAAYDDLTDLVNRREFEDRLQEVIDLAELRESDNVLCYIDLDQFKVINDTCGHMAGDELLRQVAYLLHECVRKEDVLARLGGDEFAILLENCSMQNAEIAAQKIRSTIQEFRYTWEENTFNITVSMGLVPIAIEGETITNVMRRADSACYAAKDAGRNRIHISLFGDAELTQRHGEMQWVARINEALEHGGLELWYQQISPTTSTEGASGHFEVLLRMRGKAGELIMPSTFLPAAENYDLAPRVDRWVVRETLVWLAKHFDTMSSLNCCSINLSGQTLGDAEFLAEVTGWLEGTGVPPNKICFEITETAAISNLSHAVQFMRALKELGCLFALDDFGSGLSSFAYLKSLPVDYVKIDGQFVKDVISDPVDLVMVKSINDMAHAMGKLTVAEFVEDSDILQVMVDLGVDYVQGYDIARPIPMT